MLRPLLLRPLRLLHLLLPKYRRHHRVRSFPAEPLHASQPVTQLEKLLVLLLRARRPLVAHLVSLRLAGPLAPRLVAR